MIYTNDPLALGATGRAVTYLQYRLKVSPGGDFDAVTHDALVAAQRATGNTPDGIYGPMTNAALTMGHPAKVTAVAATLSVDDKALSALLRVETAGRGFYTNGLPKILLERHYVYRLATDAQRALLPSDVCNPVAGGYSGGLAEWSRFDVVAAVSQDLAIQSCSWGIAQIMGAQCALFNMSSALFMLQHVIDEDTQIAFLGRFIGANGALRTALQQYDWTDVARLYNGPAFAENQYDQKLAAAYASM